MSELTVVQEKNVQIIQKYWKGVRIDLNQLTICIYGLCELLYKGEHHLFPITLGWFPVEDGVSEVSIKYDYYPSLVNKKEDEYSEEMIEDINLELYGDDLEPSRPDAYWCEDFIKKHINDAVFIR